VQTFAITEFNIWRDMMLPQFELGRRQGLAARALLAKPYVRFVAVYCLSEHAKMDFMTAKGERNEDRIRGFKSAIGQ
jgi:hypothetical protein